MCIELSTMIRKKIDASSIENIEVIYQCWTQSFSERTIHFTKQNVKIKHFHHALMRAMMC